MKQIAKTESFNEQKLKLEKLYKVGSDWHWNS